MMDESVLSLLFFITIIIIHFTVHFQDVITEEWSPKRRDYILNKYPGVSREVSKNL